MRRKKNSTILILTKMSQQTKKRMNSDIKKESTMKSHSLPSLLNMASLPSIYPSLKTTVSYKTHPSLIRPFSTIFTR